MIPESTILIIHPAAIPFGNGRPDEECTCGIFALRSVAYCPKTQENPGPTLRKKALRVGIQELKPKKPKREFDVWGIQIEKCGLIIHLCLQKFARQADECGPRRGCGQVLLLRSGSTFFFLEAFAMGR